MAKVIIPASPVDDIEIQGLAGLDQVDLEITIEIFERIEPTLRKMSGKVISLTDTAMYCMNCHSSDAQMLLTLAAEIGEPRTSSIKVAQSGNLH